MTNQREPTPGMLHRPADLAASFDRAAAGYAARPGYPARVYEILAACGLRDGTRVVEIGPGAGQATQPLVELGARVVAVEPGPALAQGLREAMAGAPVDVVVSPFESVELPDSAFDLVVGATSFHWVDPEVGVAKAAAALRDDGWLALWWTVWGDDDRPDPFHEALEPILTEKAPQIVGDQFGATAFLNDIEARVSYIGRSGAFGPVTRELIKWEGRHDPVGLRRMFATFGAWISLPEELREQVLDEVERLARDEFGGVVRRPYQTVVYIAQRVARTPGIR
jgi:SAM-dependent methyltransferase